MKKRKNYKHKYSLYYLELLIDILITLAIFFLFFPFLKEPLIVYKIKTTPILSIATHLPTNIPNEEKITSLSINDIFARKPKELKAYGSVSIPSIEWAQPIYVGMTNSNLFYGGVAMYPKRDLDRDNFVVFGHHIGVKEVLFGPILSAKKGAEIILTYLDQTKIYTIKDMYLIDEKETSIVNQTGNAELTIFTCPTPQVTSQRYVIRAYPREDKKESKLAENTKVEFKDMMDIQQKSLNKSNFWIVYFFLITVCLSILTIRFLFFTRFQK